MISITKKHLYHLTIYSDTVSCIDYFRLATYTAFRGKRPFLFQKEKRVTGIVSLDQSIDDIFQHMKSNYRNEIRKAISIEITIQQEDDVDAFLRYYNSFADKRGLGRITRSNITEYPSYYITKAIFNDTIISYHAYIVDEENGIVRLLYSASNRLDDNIDTKTIGYGNKYLHYSDFELFKKMGLKEYDFAGICDDPNDKEKYGIGQFKKGFGCDIVDTFTYNSPLMSLLLFFKSKFAS